MACGTTSPLGRKVLKKVYGQTKYIYSCALTIHAQTIHLCSNMCYNTNVYMTKLWNQHMPGVLQQNLWLPPFISLFFYTTPG